MLSTRSSLPFALVCLLSAGSLDAATLRGTVVDPDGRPTPGARVQVAGPLFVVSGTTTDEQGRFVFDGLEAGRYEVRVSLEGFRSDPLPVTLADGDAREVSIGLRLSALTESVVVSAAQVDLPLARTTDSVTVVTARELEARQIETVAGALRSVAGLAVTQSGGRGGLTSLFPRGGESDFTLVLVDGVRVNRFGGGFDFAHLPVADIERIEIVRGPQSALFGADAIGAVVQIVTRHGGAPRAAATVEGGAFGTTRLAATSAGSRGAWSWGLGAERLATDGFTGVAPATGETVTNDDYERQDVSLSGGWRSSRGGSVRGDVRLGSNERGFPGAFGSNPIGAVTAIDRVARGEQDTRSASVSLVHPWTPRVGQRVQLAWSSLESDFTSAFGPSSSGTRRLDARVQTDVAWRRGAGASVGVEMLGERAHSTFITGAAGAPTPIHRRVIGGFGEARLNRAERLFVTAGLRVEHIRRDPLEPSPSPFSPRPAFAADTVTSVNPKVAVSFFLEPAGARGGGWTRVRAGAGTGIRPPDAFEIAFTDNPQLRPERSRSVDAGIERALAGGAVLLEATAFFNRYDDLIVSVGRSLRDASQFRTDNISNARARGVELAGSARTAWGLDARVTYTWMDTEILAVDRLGRIAPPPFEVGDRLLRRPRHQGSVDLTLTRGPLTAFAQVTARGAVLDVEPTFGAFGGLFDTPGYGVARIGGAYRLAPAVELFGRIDNLFDRAYEETLGFPALGRSAYVGVRLAYRR